MLAVAAVWASWSPAWPSPSPASSAPEPQRRRSMDKLPADLRPSRCAAHPVLATDGTVIATWYDQNRVNVRAQPGLPMMRKAILAIEDSRFFEHGALDVQGTLRAFVTNQANAGVVQGGSSITQQMVKMTCCSPGRTDERAQGGDRRQLHSASSASCATPIAFEQKYSKDWILERYLNIAYFGDGAWGIESAARHYFSTPPSKLNLREAAMLAGMVKYPTRYDPTNYRAEAAAAPQRRARPDGPAPRHHREPGREGQEPRLGPRRHSSRATAA